MDWSRIIDRIETWLTTNGKNRAELPKILGVRPQYLSDLKSGKSRNPGSDFTIALINKMGVNPLWLESGAGDPFLKQGIGANADYAPLAVKTASGIQTVGEASTAVAKPYRVPVLKQKVSCGPGLDWETENNIEAIVEIDALIPNLGLGRVFAIKAHGSSMLGAGIRGGDYLFFDASTEMRLVDGIYVFSLDGDVFCKRLEFDKLARKVSIFSVRNPDIEKAELLMTLDTSGSDFADRFCLFGRVVRLLRKFEKEE
jgi:SOS-response transcriptional repressor LexA